MEVRKDHQECSHATLVELRRGDGDYVAFAGPTNAQTATTTLGDGVNTTGLKHSTKITATVVAMEARQNAWNRCRDNPGNPSGSRCCASDEQAKLLDQPMR